MIMKRILYLMTIACLMFSCSQNEPLAYEDDPAIYIANDDINYSFFYLETDADVDNVYIKVHAMGQLSDVDRSFSLIQSNAGAAGAAVAAKHYLAFDSEEMRMRMVMPAGRSEVEIPITLYKDASLDLTTVKLLVRVAENENFKVGVTEMKDAEIAFSAQAIKPTNWSDWYYAFGASWGSIKMRFIIDNTGITNFDKVSDDYSYLYYLNDKLKQKLLEYNTAHPSALLAEADGALVNFDNPYIWN